MNYLYTSHTLLDSLFLPQSRIYLRGFLVDRWIPFGGVGFSFHVWFGDTSGTSGRWTSFRCSSKSFHAVIYFRFCQVREGAVAVGVSEFETHLKVEFIRVLRAERFRVW